VDDDRGAELGKPPRDRMTQPSSRSGNEGHFSSE
jgi:hypothetical protein